MQILSTATSFRSPYTTFQNNHGTICSEMDPATSVTALSGLLGVLRTITGIAKDVNNVELNRQISEVQTKVFEVQEKLLALQDDNLRLREENQQLKTAVELRQQVIFHDNANWKRHDDGSEEGPFCPSCWTDGKLHRAAISYVERGEVQFVCSRHKASYPFRVPERLCKGSNLASYRQSGGDYHDPFDSPY